MPNANRHDDRHHGTGRRTGARGDLPRTKAALAAAKARGVRLGNPDPKTARFNNRKAAAAAGMKGGAMARVTADKFAELIQPLLEGDLAGLSANATAAEFNRRGVQTARGGSWTARSVLNLKARV